MLSYILVTKLAKLEPSGVVYNVCSVIVEENDGHIVSLIRVDGLGFQYYYWEITSGIDSE